MPVALAIAALLAVSGGDAGAADWAASHVDVGDWTPVQVFSDGETLMKPAPSPGAGLARYWLRFEVGTTTKYDKHHRYRSAAQLHEVACGTKQSRLIQASVYAANNLNDLTWTDNEERDFRYLVPGTVFDIVASAACEIKASEIAPTSAQSLPTNQPVAATPCAESGSCYGDTNASGRPKTVAVDGYYRKDGTYVSGYYRSTPRHH